MQKKRIKIKFQNGIEFHSSKKEILGGLLDEYDFIDSENPDFIVFGPYGNNVPEKGNYTRIGYYCECITPDLSNCEWAFGVPREEEINDYRYKRIQWHGLNPESLIKEMDAEEILSKKNKFCNFLYSNIIPHREAFFKQLSKYKKIDAPGRSMNNMLSIDSQYTGSKWDIKRQFLTPYKFTIAFESYTYPGYQTEKLYDAMQMNSIPIYCGDPNIADIFNKESFINAKDYLPVSNKPIKDFLEQNCQYNFKDYLPVTYSSIYYRVRRKLKTIGKAQKMRIELKNLDFTPLIDRIIELDKNPEEYLKMLKEPWFKNNTIPEHLSSNNRWREIFGS